MSDTLVTQMWSKDAFDVASTTGLRKKAKIVEGFQITCPPDYTKAQVSLIDGVPEIGDSFPGNQDVRVVSRNYQRLGPAYWLATVAYEGEFPAMGTKPVIKWSNVESDEPVDEDFDGNPIVTANGEPMEGVTTKINDFMLSVKRNYRTINIPATHAYLRSVNSDTFEGFAPGIARMTAFDATQVYDANENGYWEVNARIVFRVPYNTTPQKAWYARLRHEGYYERIIKYKLKENGDPQTVAGVPQIESQRIVHAVVNKETATRPVLLKADGTRETDETNAYWKEFKRYGTLPYNALGLT